MWNVVRHASIVSHSHADLQLLELVKCHLSLAQKDQRGLCLAMQDYVSSDNFESCYWFWPVITALANSCGNLPLLPCGCGQSIMLVYFQYNVQSDQLIVSLSLGKITIEPFYSMCTYVIAPNVGFPVTIIRTSFTCTLCEMEGDWLKWDLTPIK
jgi:hypothetical protein